MEGTIIRPDIINPYPLGQDGFQDEAFAIDTGLEDLLDYVPFLPSNAKESRAFARTILVKAACDMQTVEYRQAVFDDLFPNHHLRNKLRSCIKSLSELAVALARFSNKTTLANGLGLLRRYREFLESPTGWGEAKAGALRAVAAYFDKIRSSDDFSGLRQFLNLIDTSAEIDFRVSLDKNGSPLSMYALNMVPKEPEEKPGIMTLLGRLLRLKRQEQNLRTSGSFNQLGKIIQDYMDRQFIPVIRAYTDQIRELTGLVEPLDFYAAFAEYFAVLKELGFEICKPTLLPAEQRRMFARNARNPLLLGKGVMASRGIGVSPVLLRARDSASKIIPNDIRYNAEENMFVITGPNNGGKTTYVKTIGLVQLMSQKGLLAPAQSAEVSFVDGVYTHFVAPDDITKGEGRYRNELRRMKEVFERATPYSLVILDEPCGGTSHEEGMRQSRALLQGFHKLGAVTYFTTHMHALTEDVDQGRFPAAKNLSVECRDDGTRMVYTYKIKAGASGKSYGQEIAREVGLMPDNIARTVSQKAQEQGYGKILRE